MSQFPFGVAEADIPILLQLNDEDLISTCRSSAYLTGLCSDDYFWNLRVNEYYPRAIGLRDRYSSWRDFYTTLARSGYVLYSGDLSIYNSVQGIQGVQQAEDRLRILYGPGFRSPTMEIYLASMGDEFYRKDPHHLIEDLEDLPTLTPRTFVLYTLDGYEIIGVGSFSPATLNKITQYAIQDRLDKNLITVMRSDAGVKRYFVYKPELNIFLSKQIPILAIIDNDLGVLSRDGYDRIEYLDWSIPVPDSRSIMRNLDSFIRQPLANIVDYPMQ